VDILNLVHILDLFQFKLDALLQEPSGKIVCSFKSTSVRPSRAN
jgi:hypothetical protein